MMGNRAKTVRVVGPDEIKITGVLAVKRDIYYDDRGFLVETFAKSKEKDCSVYSYCSFTRPGFARDIDRFHFHKDQEDRFTIAMGTMWILLYDRREHSPSTDVLQVLELVGANLDLRAKTSIPCYTVVIPRGVYHGVMNPGPSPAILVNHPTQEYDPGDEGRELFRKFPLKCFDGKCFSWSMVGSMGG